MAGYATTSKIFLAKVKEGKLLIGDPEAFHAFLQTLGERDVELVLQRAKSESTKHETTKNYPDNLQRGQPSSLLPDR